MGRLRKVVLSQREVLQCLLGLGAEEQPSSGSSHRKFHCWVRGVKRSVTLDAAIRDFSPDAYSPLWFMVNRQLEVSWEEFYASDPDVAHRAGVAPRSGPLA